MFNFSKALALSQDEKDKNNDYKNLMEGDSKDPFIKSVTFENLRKKNQYIQVILSKIETPIATCIETVEKVTETEIVIETIENIAESDELPDVVVARIIPEYCRKKGFKISFFIFRILFY